MKPRMGRQIVFVCALVAAVHTATLGQELSKSEGDLRSRMAGAWRSTQRKPRAQSARDSQDANKKQDQKTKYECEAKPAATSSQPSFRGFSMDAIARRIAKLDQVLYFEDDLCVMASEGRQMFFKVQYEGGVARRIDLTTGMAMSGELTIEDGLLVARIPSMNFKVYYRRLDKVPESVRLDPYKLGEREPTDAQRAAIQNDIAQRTKEDQHIRLKAMEANRMGRTDVQLTLSQLMAEIDRDNTGRMVELIQDVGWLSKARFGGKTQLGAFLIVQHSDNLRLMRTVLPMVKAEAKGNPRLGQSYALLYDRLQLRLGRKQRYGTQADTNPDGSMTIGRLEDRSRVDAWRKEMGLEPLADYARTMAEGYGVKVTTAD